MKAFLVCLSLCLSSLAFAVPQTNQIEVEAGRFTGVNRQWLQKLANSCGVQIFVETDRRIPDRVFYVTYIGEYENSLCFYNGIMRLNSPRRY